MIFDNESKIQKSKVLLYPLVGNSHKDLYIPTNTYLYWKEYSIENFELMVYYEKISKDFERTLLSNPNLESCHEIENNGMMYIMDLINWSDEVYNFLEGKYSKYSEKAKRKICKYYGATEVSKKAFDTFTVNIALTPELYRDRIISELNLDDDFVVEEAFSRFNKEKETCFLNSVKNSCCKPQKTVYFNQ